MTLVHDSGVILDTSHSLGLWVKTSDNTKQKKTGDVGINVEYRNLCRHNFK